MPKNIKKRLRNVVVVVACAASFSSASAHACTTIDVQYNTWFNESWSFDPSTIPPGVSIPTTPFASEPIIVITNATSTPFYVPRKFSYSFVPTNTQLPSGIVPFRKYVDGRVYEYSLVDDEYKDAADLLRSDRNGKNFDLRQNIGVANNNVATYKRRPKNIEVPSPTPFTLTAYFGAQQVLIKGTITHQLNPTFAPSNKPSSCSPQDPFPVIAGTLVTVFIVLVMLIIWVFRKKPSAPNNKNLS